MPRRKKAPEAERSTPRAKPAQRAKPAEPDIDREIAEDFQERQELSQEGRERLAENLEEHNSLSPEISANDVDAAWELGRESGEETFTGHAPTPDQDRVDDMGAAAGLTYKDDEPLQYSKVARRDDRRWELDARSAKAEQTVDEDVDDDVDEDDEDDTADAPDAPLRFWDLADDLDAEVEEELDDEDEEDEDDEEDEEDEDLADTLDEELVAVGGDAEADEEDELEDELDDGELDSDLDEDLDELDDLDEDEDEDDD